MSGITNPFQSRFARCVTVTDSGGSRRVRAFVQPLRVESPETPAITGAGVVDNRRWRVLLPLDSLDGAVEISDSGTVYVLLRRENIGGHIEGILCRKGGGGDA